MKTEQEIKDLLSRTVDRVEKRMSEGLVVTRELGAIEMTLIIFGVLEPGKNWEEQPNPPSKKEVKKLFRGTKMVKETMTDYLVRLSKEFLNK